MRLAECLGILSEQADEEVHSAKVAIGEVFQPRPHLRFDLDLVQSGHASDGICIGSYRQGWPRSAPRCCDRAVRIRSRRRAASVVRFHLKPELIFASPWQSCALYDVAGDDRRVVDLLDALDLDEQAVDEPEVAAGDAADCGDSLGVGEVREVQGEPELAPVPAQDGPTGSFVIEQADAPNELFCILSGSVDIVREGVDGRLRTIDTATLGAFVGQDGSGHQPAPQRPHDRPRRRACFVLAPGGRDLSAGRGIGAISSSAVPTQAGRSQFPSGVGEVAIDVSAALDRKIAALVSHRSQYALDAELLPRQVMAPLLGIEHFTVVGQQRDQSGM